VSFVVKVMDLIHHPAIPVGSPAFIIKDSADHPHFHRKDTACSII